MCPEKCGWLDLVLKEIEDLSSKFTQNRRMKAILGNVICLSTRDVWFIPIKFGRVKKCLKLLDEAVLESHSNPQILAIRAGNALKLPERFKRRPVAIDDINLLLENMPASPKNEEMRVRLLVQLVLLYGDEGDRENQASAYQTLQSEKSSADVLAVARNALIK